MGPEKATFVKTKTVLFFFLKELQMVTPMKLKDLTYPFTYVGKLCFYSFSLGEKTSWEASEATSRLL